MLRINQRTASFLLAILFVLSNQACSAPQTKVDATQTPAATDTSIPSSTPTLTAAPTIIPSASPTNDISLTPTFVSVSISAESGNLFIRRGPDLAYNQVGALMKGETATVLARDVAGEWVEVIIPSKTDKTGWVSIQTKYAVVHGNVMRLPAKAITDWPVAAYVRNCTANQMFLLPGEIVIPPLSKYPENEVWVNPGIYKAYDEMVIGHPVVLEISLSEGKTVDIETNGSGVHHKCP